MQIQILWLLTKKYTSFHKIHNLTCLKISLTLFSLSICDKEVKICILSYIFLLKDWLFKVLHWDVQAIKSKCVKIKIWLELVMYRHVWWVVKFPWVLIINDSCNRRNMAFQNMFEEKLYQKSNEMITLPSG